MIHPIGIETTLQRSKIGLGALNNGETARKACRDSTLCGAPPPKWPSIPEDAALSKYFTVGRHGKVRDFCLRWRTGEL